MTIFLFDCIPNLDFTTLKCGKVKKSVKKLDLPQPWTINNSAKWQPTSPRVIYTFTIGQGVT